MKIILGLLIRLLFVHTCSCYLRYLVPCQEGEEKKKKERKEVWTPICWDKTWISLFSYCFLLGRETSCRMQSASPREVSALEQGLWPFFRWLVNVTLVKLTMKLPLNIDPWIRLRINCWSLSFSFTQFCINLTLKGSEFFELTLYIYSSKYFCLMKYYIKFMLYDFL